MQKDKIVKYKNGNIVIYPYSDYHKDIDSYYDDITMHDLYFNQINGYMYLVDFNTGNVYDFSQCYINILQYLDNELSNGKIKLYPLSKKEAKSLLQDLNNGY